jgi:ribosomal protein S21
MTQVTVTVTPDKGFEGAIKEFHRKVQEQGVIPEIRRRSFFVPQAEARKLKGIEARKRNRPRTVKPTEKRIPKV